MPPKSGGSTHQRWALFRFSVVGPLFANPPGQGALVDKLTELSLTPWTHPITEKPVVFTLKTIERWYYQAKKTQQPVEALRPKIRKDHRCFPSIKQSVAQALRTQYQEHPSWSYKLHWDNLNARAASDASLNKIPVYHTIRRYLKAQGMLPQAKEKPSRSEAEYRARQHKKQMEIRSYESPYVGSLWHLDFHHGSRRVLLPNGSYTTPFLLGVLDDHSRLVCHLQWYYNEGAEELIHGLIQAFLKWGLPRALMTDNGAAMLAAETTQGLARLSILHQTTLPYSPYQNGKQESFWGKVEGRLVAMLENKQELTLSFLNEATQAWVYGDYNQVEHSETKQTPSERFLHHENVLRESPSPQTLRETFRQQTSRAQRRSDGTVSIEGIRFEVPSRFSHLARVDVRFSRWDRSQALLVDGHSNKILSVLYPVDRQANAEGKRALKEQASVEPMAKPTEEVAPLLANLMQQYVRTGQPPAYIPLDKNPEKGI